jgi:hypothetical protein
MKVSEDLFRRLLEAPRGPEEAIATLVQYWSPRALHSQDQLRFGLSEPEFHVHVVVIYDGEVGNGGHSQFFSKPSGANAQAVASALHALQLEAVADVYARARSVFPRGVVPAHGEARERIIEELPEAAFKQWALLDREYFSLNGGLDATLLDYLRARADEVLLPERAA